MERWILILVFLLAGCATPIRSTVDGYGEAPLGREEPLFFDRESLPLAERPISDPCRDAARDLKLSVRDQPCPDCRRVEVRSRLAGTTQAIRSGPSFGTSVGLFGGGTAFGVGVGTGSAESRPETERIIEIQIFATGARDPLRTISTRSLGRDNSVSAVAYEMCVAALRDYPANLKGKVYDVKPGKTEP